MAPYSNAADVIEYTGVKPGDLYLESDAALATLLDKWLVQVSALMHKHQRVEYEDPDEELTAALDNIAMRICANMIGQAKLRRDYHVIRIGDFAVRMVEDAILTSDILNDLAALPNKRHGWVFI